MSMYEANHFVIDIEVDPTEPKPYYLVVSYKGDIRILERMINVIGGMELYYVTMIFSNRWRFLPSSESWNFGYKYGYSLEGLIHGNEKIYLSTMKQSLKAQKEIGRSLNNLAIRETKNYNKLKEL